MNKKMLIGLAVTAVFLLSLFTPMLIVPASAADPSYWYTTVPGVLTSDYYVLYPYKTYSIDFGLSKFGEMINYPVTPGVGLGLQYPGYDKAGTYNQKLTTIARDPFANEYIDPKLWLNGWLIEVRYTHRTLRDRYIIAMAMFADMAAYGGDWLVGHRLPLDTAPHGGRKTNAYAETEDLKVLYNGPRLYVAQSVTHLYDWFDSDGDGEVEHPDETWPIVDIKLTFVFEKVKKYVIIFKDIKQIISGKELDSPLDIQFSNREEWDLGPIPDFDSYAHFFHQEFETCYGPEWHLAPGIMREFKVAGWGLSEVPTTANGPDGTTWIGPIIEGSVRVYVNGVWKEPGRDYDIDAETGEISWKIPIGDEDWVEVVYKLWKDETKDKGVPHLYDVAQIISSDLKYVGFKAFWPVLSDYTVDGWALSFRPLINVSDADMVPAAKEPDIPMVIGEWDFMLGKGYPEQFRGVEVIGITDYNDAQDPQMLKKQALLDREIRYLLTEVFYPWDLQSAVEKDTSRYVKFAKGPLSSGAVIPLGEPLVSAEWDSYCSFTERVLLLPDGTLWRRGTQYILWDKDGDGACDSIKLLRSVAPGKTLKILYSTDTYYETSGVLNFEFSAINKTLSASKYSSWTDPLGAVHKLGLDDIVISVDILNWTKDFTATFRINEDWGWAEDFKVFKESFTTISWDHNEEIVRENENVSMTMWIDIHWYITPPYLKDLHVLYVEWGTDITVTISYNATTREYNITAAVALNYYYGETIPGRYEWIVVGRDAATVDSAGAALVSAAFKNKQVEIGLAGADMEAKAVYDEMPWVMYKFGTSNEKADYKDSLGRAALKDDWCETWPVASSNMIAVGGPLANMLAYYANDFTSAFYGLPEYACSGWANKIIALSCWSQNTYASDANTGYAVVATYKDINGTVLFLIWGHWGRDTYYATKWFHEEGIYELQRSPPCVTAIILKIDYTKHEPAVSVVEVLGTISERLWIDGTIKKGGIHPDP